MLGASRVEALHQAVVDLGEVLAAARNAMSSSAKKIWMKKKAKIRSR